MKTVAVMQPYFFPYLGYFRLFLEADLFVVLDCVQFPRRGWVHRNRICCEQKDKWVTMPLSKAPREARIGELAFRDPALCKTWYSDICSLLERQFPVRNRELMDTLIELLRPHPRSVVSYLEQQLKFQARCLGVSRPTIRSSELGISENLRGTERTLAICEAVGATDYINLPGGRHLYSAVDFSERGVRLHVLPEYEGQYESMLSRLMREPLKALTSELLDYDSPISEPLAMAKVMS